MNRLEKYLQKLELQRERAESMISLFELEECGPSLLCDVAERFEVRREQAERILWSKRRLEVLSDWENRYDAYQMDLYDAYKLQEAALREDPVYVKLQMFCGDPINENINLDFDIKWLKTAKKLGIIPSEDPGIVVHGLLYRFNIDLMSGTISTRLDKMRYRLMEEKDYRWLDSTPIGELALMWDKDFRDAVGAYIQGKPFAKRYRVIKSLVQS